jgi:hypothetical protein
MIIIKTVTTLSPTQAWTARTLGHRIRNPLTAWVYLRYSVLCYLV